MRTLQRLGIPTIIFVNKIDRSGAQYESLLQSISEKLTSAIAPMGSISGLGTRDALCTANGDADAEFVYELVELLADHDDTLLAEYVDDTNVPYRRLRRELATQTRRATVHPVFFGSAGTAGEKIAYVRMFSGAVRMRDRLRLRGGEGKITAINIIERGTSGQSTSVAAGQIGKLWGLDDVCIGDAIGDSKASAGRHHFAPPTLETVVVPCRPDEKGALH